MKQRHADLAVTVADRFLAEAARDGIAERLAETIAARVGNGVVHVDNAVVRAAGDTGEETVTPDEIMLAHDHLYETRGEFQVWLVHGDYIRREIDTDFTNFGQHYRFFFIPEKEFWIDNSVFAYEYGFYIDHMATEYRLMVGGDDYDHALEYADRKERDERQSAGGVYRGPMDAPDAAERVHREQIDAYSNAYVTCWLVDGDLIRKDYDDDFTEGGHDLVYATFIPPGEMWLDDEDEPPEMPFFALHELTERGLMLTGIPYDRAHHEASRVELEARLHPETLTAKLAEALKANEHATAHALIAPETPLGGSRSHFDNQAAVLAIVKRPRRRKISMTERRRVILALNRRLKRFEHRISAAMRRVWAHERKIMLAHMKHSGHQKDCPDCKGTGYAHISTDVGLINTPCLVCRGSGKDYRPDLIERWLAGSSAMKNLTAEELRPIFKAILDAEGDALNDNYGLGIDFDMTSPALVEYLRTYTIKLADQLQTTSQEMLTDTLRAGMIAGEGIPDLTRRITEMFQSWDRYRAERIARTETLRASNAAAVETYKQSGLESKEWMASEDDLTCFPANTNVITRSGETHIQDIQKGDEVLTHAGWRRVSRTMRRRYAGKMIEIETSDGRRLTATAEHQVYEVGYGWREIQALRHGSRLKTSDNQIIQVTRVFYFTLGNVEHKIAKFAQSRITLGVFKRVRTPIRSIYLKARILLRQIKVDAESSSGMLWTKGDVQTLQGFTNRTLNRSLAAIFATARKATKSSLRMFRWCRSKSLAAVQAVNEYRRATAGFRTILLPGRICGELFPASGAYFPHRELCPAGPTANLITMSDRLVNLKILPADRADLCNHRTRARQSAACPRAMRFAPMGGVGVESFAANGARLGLPKFRGPMVTRPRTILRSRAGLQFISWDKLLVAIRAYIHGIYRYYTTLVLGSQSYFVFNLEVEGAHTYFANGILVHNCEDCAVLDGEVVALDEDFSDGENEPPDHPNCRCCILPIVPEIEEAESENEEEET